METFEPPGSATINTEHEPNFLLVRDTLGDWPRWKRAVAGTAVVHLIAITLLFTIKGTEFTLPPEPEPVEHVTKLYVPKDLTQKAPNHGPVDKLMLTQNRQRLLPGNFRRHRRNRRRQKRQSPLHLCRCP